MAGCAPSRSEEIEQWKELSAYLFDLAVHIHEHSEMLFRLSDRAKEQADKLQRAGLHE